VVGLFSKALVVVLGLLFMLNQVCYINAISQYPISSRRFLYQTLPLTQPKVAARYSLDLVALLRLDQRFKKAASLRSSANMLSRLSFAATFTLAAFVHL
jgi:hypothetical protein